MSISLFSPVALRSTTVRNRLWIAPMCQYSVLAEDGVPTDWHLVHLGSLARGGAGMVIAEATGVSPEGRISPRDTGIWNDEQVAAWRPITEFIRSQGAVAGIQLGHAGRKASTAPGWGTDVDGTVPEQDGGWQPVAPSALAFPGYATPSALDGAGIDKVVDDFAAAARRSADAGFEAVEIHAAHGYLLHQFLSPLSNERTDEYGGSLENRARLTMRVIGAVRGAVGDDVLVLLRVSGTDWLEGGWDVEQTATLAGWARDAGVDLVDVSSGGVLPARIEVGPGYQVSLAAHVREATGMPVSAVGLITDPDQAQAILDEGSADVVQIARESLRDPHFPIRAALALGATDVPIPPQYERALSRR